jgi:hypothetical protein
MLRRFHKLAPLVLLVPLVIHVQGCRYLNSVENISVSLKSTEVYQYPTVSGDEDGARISTQAAHYSISEIRRNAATNWASAYVYQPAASFVGSDYAEIEILTGSDGASLTRNIKKVAFRFVIHN